MNVRLLVSAALASAIAASLASAATLKLRDGTTLIGEVKKFGGSYSVVTPDGTRKLLPASDIASINGKPISDTSASGSEGSVGASATIADPSANASAGFRETKSKADRVDAPVIAVQLWEEFIQSNPKSADLDAAKAEKATWDKLYKDKAEKIKGKWVGGQELKDLKKKCREMLVEAIDPGDEGVRGVNGLHKLDEILAIYPNQSRPTFIKATITSSKPPGRGSARTMRSRRPWSRWSGPPPSRRTPQKFGATLPSAITFGANIRSRSRLPTAR